MRRKVSLISIFMLLAVLLAACGNQPSSLLNTVMPQVTEVGPTALQGAQTVLPAVTELVPTALQGAETVLPALTELAPTLASASIQDFNTLVAGLGAAGMIVEPGGAVQQPFFTAPGQSVKVNGEELQVYTYETAEALEAEASQVAPDASTIGTNTPSWVDSPHLYKTGRLLVIYVGQNQKILDLLDAAFGAQFAGR